MRRTKEETIDKQVKARVTSKVKKKAEYDGNTELMISTGSTLLDLAISGGRIRGGGIPGGIMVEIFGPESSGKTVLLCEIAGDVHRKGGDIAFHDPEARLNNQFAKIFGLDTEDMTYAVPDTVTALFTDIRKWIPEASGVINGVFADSLAALSTDLEMGSEDGDKMGMRRPKEFSEQLRLTCRILTKSKTLLVCSNQIRENIDRGSFGQKYKAPGGKGPSFYSSVRLRTNVIGNLSRERMRKGKKLKQIYGAVIEVEVFKSSVWHPKRKAQVAINFSYGVDDIRENLKYVKAMTGSNVYVLGELALSKSIEESIAIIEDSDWVDDLREEVIDIWEDIEESFKVERKPKKR